MKIVMWKGTKIGELHDDGRLAYGNPCLVEMFAMWTAMDGILRFVDGGTLDGVQADVPTVVPFSLEAVTAELAMVGFNLVDVPSATVST